MVDTFVENNSRKCINCKGCSIICPEKSIYINEFEFDGRITYHLHLKKEKQYCKKCIRTKGYAPCVEICPENAIKIISR